MAWGCCHLTYKLWEDSSRPQAPGTTFNPRVFLHHGVPGDCGEYIALVVNFHPDGIRPHKCVASPSISSLLDAKARFLSADVAVIFPTKVPLPCFELSPLAKFLAKKSVIKPRKSSCRRRHLRLDFTTVPLFAVLLLLATKCIDGNDLRRGIVGDGGVKPLSIMALFISLVCNAS